jgi:hypothetical protein
MNVIAVSTPGQQNWLWRIVDYDGKPVEDSYTAFPTISEALAEGHARLRRNVEREAIERRR